MCAPRCGARPEPVILRHKPHHRRRHPSPPLTTHSNPTNRLGHEQVFSQEFDYNALVSTGSQVDATGGGVHRRLRRAVDSASLEVHTEFLAGLREACNDMAELTTTVASWFGTSSGASTVTVTMPRDHDSGACERCALGAIVARPCICGGAEKRPRTHGSTLASDVSFDAAWTYSRLEKECSAVGIVRPRGIEPAD